MSETTGKQKRRVIGSVLKSKDNPKGSYFKVGREDVTLKAGEILNLDSKEEQLERLAKVVAEGKLSAEMGEKARERIEKIPDFVRFEIVQKYTG